MYLLHTQHIRSFRLLLKRRISDFYFYWGFLSNTRF